MASLSCSQGLSGRGTCRRMRHDDIDRETRLGAARDLHSGFPGSSVVTLVAAQTQT